VRLALKPFLRSALVVITFVASFALACSSSTGEKIHIPLSMTQASHAAPNRLLSVTEAIALSDRFYSLIYIHEPSWPHRNFLPLHTTTYPCDLYIHIANAVPSVSAGETELTLIVILNKHSPALTKLHLKDIEDMCHSDNDTPLLDKGSVVMVYPREDFWPLDTALPPVAYVTGNDTCTGTYRTKNDTTANSITRDNCPETLNKKRGTLFIDIISSRARRAGYYSFYCTGTLVDCGNVNILPGDLVIARPLSSVKAKDCWLAGQTSRPGPIDCDVTHIVSHLPTTGSTSHPTQVYVFSSDPATMQLSMDIYPRSEDEFPIALPPGSIVFIPHNTSLIQ